MSTIYSDKDDAHTKKLIELFLAKRLGKKVALSLFADVYGKEVTTEPINVVVAGVNNGKVWFCVDTDEISSIDDTPY